MSSTVFWRYLTMLTRKWWMVIASVVLIFLVGISRLYLRVHWMGDILMGWSFGFTILLSVSLFKEPIDSYLSKQNVSSNQIYIGMAIFGFLLMIITETVYYEPTYNFGTPGGQMIGLGVGFFLKNKYVNFKTYLKSEEKWLIIIRVLGGFIFVFSVYIILEILLSSAIF